MKYAVTATVYLTIEVNDPDVVERALTEEWQSHFYRFGDAEEVIEHFAFNAIRNGASDVSRLEGWADLDSDAAKIEVDDIDFWVEERPYDTVGQNP